MITFPHSIDCIYECRLCTATPRRCLMVSTNATHEDQTMVNMLVVPALVDDDEVAVLTQPSPPVPHSHLICRHDRMPARDRRVRDEHAPELRHRCVVTLANWLPWLQLGVSISCNATVSLTLLGARLPGCCGALGALLAGASESGRCHCHACQNRSSFTLESSSPSIPIPTSQCSPFHQRHPVAAFHHLPREPRL